MLSLSKILLINPSFESVYKSVNIKEGALYSPVLSLPVLASPLVDAGYKVEIYDMNVESSDETKFLNKIKNFLPQFIGITFVTPLFDEMVKITKSIKTYDKSIIVIGGGAHASSFPELTLKESELDIVVKGEGDFTLKEIVETNDFSNVQGIYYRKGNGEIVATPPRELIKNLDILPMPKWELYNIPLYKTTDLMCKENPTGWMETSRGCVMNCIYCNKSIFGKTFRVKSAKRVVDEMQRMLALGFKEIHFTDDCFSTDIKRAKEVCNEILSRNLHFPWAPVTGLRVDRVDQELFDLMKKSGCYRVYFGIESGSPKMLKRINKGATVEQAEYAVSWAKKSGLETFGFFMIGLPDETEETMQETIDFALKLDLDMAKMCITIPLPATPFYNELKNAGYIKTNIWSKFNLYTIPKELFDNPTLSWEIIDKYYHKFYKKFYWRPSFILKRFIKSFKNGTLIADIIHFSKTKW